MCGGVSYCGVLERGPRALQSSGLPQSFVLGSPEVTPSLLFCLHCPGLFWRPREAHSGDRV